ncbi:MAG: arylamine N-acetyltransferase [Acutalibacteraceae bacterium]|nr:arylamine N-acetyltransferase [Acutalibacteraceae bacterium]
MYNSLVEHKGSCMGYSLAMQYLLNKLGVTCRVQTGVATNPKGNKEDHMWNIVTLNGKEYLVDVTWDDVLVNGYNYAPYRYFNVTKDMMSETHTPKNASEWSKCTNTDQDWYRKNGFYFNSWDEVMKAMPTMIAKQGGDKGNPVSFRLPSTKMANEISSHITGGTAGSMNDLTGGKAIYTSKKGTLGATGFRY